MGEICPRCNYHIPEQETFLSCEHEYYLDDSTRAQSQGGDGCPGAGTQGDCLEDGEGVEREDERRLGLVNERVLR